MAAHRRVKKVSKAEQRSQRRRADQVTDGPVPPVIDVASQTTPKKPIPLPATIVIRDLAPRLEVPVGRVMQELLKNGIMATLNESIDFDTAAIIADELGFEAQHEENAAPPATELVAAGPREIRPPVITVMGHVDHGKTKLLDALRHTDIVSQESGGITQHIGAYQVKINDRLVTFLDTPGHEAFAALRAHGATITDIVILVIAANEGVRPQTIEALSHARAANVPMIVALTKIDLPDINLDRIKRELAAIGLNPEEWGGKTIVVPVSAKTGENLEQLLEMVLLVADLADLTAHPQRTAIGVVVDARLQAGLGPLATVLVQDGTLRTSDVVVIGSTWGKIRVMQDWRGKRLAEAGPGTPVQIAGLKDVPRFGDRMHVIHDEKQARAHVQTKSAVRRTLSLGSVSSSIKEGDIRELPIILKADVPGSLAAITTALAALSHDGVQVQWVYQGIGSVSDSDIQLAAAAKALVIAFRVPIIPSAKRLTEQLGVAISTYDIIYQLIDDVAAALAGLLAPEIVEIELGRMAILKVFQVKGHHAIVGGKVIGGTLERHGFVRILRGEQVVGEGKLDTLQREKESVTSVTSGFECGAGIDSTMPPEVGDQVVVFKTEERTRRLS